MAIAAGSVLGSVDAAPAPEIDLDLSLVPIDEWGQKPSSFRQMGQRGRPDGVRLTHVFDGPAA